MQSVLSVLWLLWISQVASRGLRAFVDNEPTHLRQHPRWWQAPEPRQPAPACNDTNIQFSVNGVRYEGQFDKFMDHLLASSAPSGSVLAVTAAGRCGPFIGPTTTVFARANHSDVLVFRDIYIRHEFSFLEAALSTSLITNVIDLGMNVGLSMVYWAEHYPHAKVIGVEPQLENFALAGLNVAHRRNVHVERAAVSSKLGWGNLKSVGSGDWGWGTNSADQLDSINAFQTITIPYLLDKYGWDKVDLLKIDIEGGELDLCNDIMNGAKWINAVKCVTFEYHDWLFPNLNGSIEKTCVAAMKRAGMLLQGHTSVDNLFLWCRV